MLDSDYEGNERKESKELKKENEELDMSGNFSADPEYRGTSAGVTKNLRARKQINYNENQLPVISGDTSGLDNLNLSGSKRNFQSAFKEETEPSFSGSQVKGLKRSRLNNHFYSNENEYTPSGGGFQGPLRHTVSAANLLQ